MKPLSLVATLGSAAAVLVSMPALGSAATPAANNTIALTNYAVYDSPNLEGNISFQGHVRVTFRNDGDVAATAVVFDVRDDQTGAQRIDDVGNYAKGVTVTHEFHYLNVHAGEALQVAEVRYADGTVWTNDDTPAPLVRRQAR
jgi:hypothetical protein